MTSLRYWQKTLKLCIIGLLSSRPKRSSVPQNSSYNMDQTRGVVTTPLRCRNSEIIRAGEAKVIESLQVFIVPEQDCKFGLDCKNQKHGAIQPAIKSYFWEWISNPGAIHQKGMQSGFRNPAIAILPMPAGGSVCCD